MEQHLVDVCCAPKMTINRRWTVKLARGRGLAADDVPQQVGLKHLIGFVLDERVLLERTVAIERARVR